METQALEGGFRHPPQDAARAFRAIMTAMARPGRIEAVEGVRPPAPLSVAAGVALATLCDADTPLWLAPSVDQPGVRDWIAFHTGAPLAGPPEAMFALGRWEEFPLDDFAIGTPEYPDRSATLIIETAALSAEGTALRGPGIAGVAHLSLPEAEAFARNAQLFPLGLDCLFTCADRIAGLPRSTRIG